MMTSDSDHRDDGQPLEDPSATTASTRPTDRQSVVSRQRERFGGVKPFVAFFGWLAATGMVVLLTAVVAAVGLGIGQLTTPQDVADLAAERGTSDGRINWVGAGALVAIVVVSYYAGGYVAGRMARFDGMRQGAAVWGWAVLVAAALTVLGLLAGGQDAESRVDSLPQLSGSWGDLSAPGLAALLGVVVGSLVGALLGGLAGMHFHRKVDREGLGR